MLSVDSWIQERDIDARMIMQVHDELVLEVPLQQLEEVCAEVTKRMSEAADLDIPLLVDVGTGDDWDAAH